MLQACAICSPFSNGATGQFALSRFYANHAREHRSGAALDGSSHILFLPRKLEKLGTVVA